MANKIKVFESKTKDKKGNTVTSVHIFGSMLPEPDLKVIEDDADSKIVKLPKKGRNKNDDRKS